MSKYINADDALEFLSLMYDNQEDKDDPYNVGVMGAINYIKHKAPSIDIEPKRGEWIYNSALYASGNPHYDCNCCGESVEEQTKFCPNCGARMKGADDETNHRNN